MPFSTHIKFFIADTLVLIVGGKYRTHTNREARIYGAFDLDTRQRNIERERYALPWSVKKKVLVAGTPRHDFLDTCLQSGVARRGDVIARELPGYRCRRAGDLRGALAAAHSSHHRSYDARDLPLS